MRFLLLGLVALSLVAQGCSLGLQPPLCGDDMKLLNSGACLGGDLAHEHVWVEDVLEQVNLPDPRGLTIFLWSSGDYVDFGQEHRLPGGTCVNGFYEDGVVHAVPGSLAHELFHVFADQTGTAVPVYEVGNIALQDLYEAQHTPAFGWRRGYDYEVGLIYRELGYGQSPWEVCSGWND